MLLLLFGLSVMSCSLQSHGLQHAWPLYPSPSPKFAQVHVHFISDAIQPSHPLISPFPSALNLSQRQGLYQWVDCLYRTVFGCTRWPKYWSFSFSISPSKEYSGLISTKIDWFDLQGTSGVFSSTTVQRHQFFGILPSLKQNSRAHQSVQ